MATLPTPEESARVVLGIYKRFGIRPGEVLRGNNFMAIAAKIDVRPEDIGVGLEYGYGQGWFEDGPNGSVRLTELGFSEI